MVMIMTSICLSFKVEDEKWYDYDLCDLSFKVEDEKWYDYDLKMPC